MKTVFAIATVALGLAAGSAFADESPRGKDYPNAGQPAAAASFVGGNAAQSEGFTRMLAESFGHDRQ